MRDINNIGSMLRCTNSTVRVGVAARTKTRSTWTLGAKVPDLKMMINDDDSDDGDDGDDSIDNSMHTMAI